MDDRSAGPPAGDGLPLDPDVEVDESPGRAPLPVHVTWRAILLVVLGGAIGTCARYVLSQLIPAWNGIPLAILLINVTGAFLLGALLEALARGGLDVGRRRTLRLFAGTGILGGYTTYSTFAVDTDGLLQAAQFGPTVLYALGTVLVGAAASVAGIAVGKALHRARASARRSS